MKRKSIGMLAAAGALALVIGTGTTALAAGTGYGRNFSDANQNGVCDWAEDARRCADLDRDGICNYTGHRYLDTDQDGVCDYAGGVCQNRKGNGSCSNFTGKRMGRGAGFHGGRSR